MNKDLLKRAIEGLDEYFITTEAGKNLVDEIQTEINNPEPKPIAWKYIMKYGVFFTQDKEDTEHDDIIETTPLYASPVVRKQLTDDEIGEVIQSVNFKEMVTTDDVFYWIARAVERKIHERMD
jgi:hypothetical protein